MIKRKRTYYSHEREKSDIDIGKLRRQTRFILTSRVEC